MPAVGDLVLIIDPDGVERRYIAAVLAGEEISELAGAVDLRRVVRNPGAVAQRKRGRLGLRPVVGAEDVGSQFGGVSE